MQESKTSLCSSCPSFTAPGRCVGHGAPASKLVFLLGPPKDNITEPCNDYIAHRDSIGKLFHQIYERVLVRHPLLRAAPYFKAHAAQCVLEKDDAETVKHCKDIVHPQIAMSGAKVIFAMGSSAMRSLGITGSVDSVRGKVLEAKVGSRQVKVICSYNPGAFYRREQVGLVSTFEQDLTKALQLSLDLTSRRTVADLTKNFILEKTPEGAISLCEKILAERDAGGKPPLLAVDTETTGLETWLPDFRCIAFSFCWGEGKSGAFLYNHREAEPGGWEKILPKLREVLEGPNPKTLHNFQYDYKVIEEALGLKITNVVWDSMLGEYLLDENKQGLYGLKDIVRTRVPEFTDYEKSIKAQIKNKKSYAEEIAALDNSLDAKKAHEKWAREQKKLADSKEKKASLSEVIADAKKEIEALKDQVKALKKNEKQEREKDDSFENIAVDDLLLYAAIDTECTWRISQQQVKEIKAEDSGMFKVMRDLQLPGARTLGHIEHVGVRVDTQYLEKLDEEFSELMEKSEKEINDYLDKNSLRTPGETINLNAQADIIKLLTVKLGLQLLKTTKKTGALAVDKDVLESLENKHPLVKAISTWKKAAKAKTTYVENIKKFSKGDGRVHTSYGQTTTVTGRLCLAEGTLIDTPRNLEKDPGGIPIEQIRPGQLVYCYDNDLNLVLRKVTWSGKTGVKSVIRLHWESEPGRRKETGYLDLTPEHRVRLYSGVYAEAVSLKPGDSVSALSRLYNNGRVTLNARGSQIPEHRFVYSSIHGEIRDGSHVHHRDHNYKNNHPDNLQLLTAQDHTGYHSRARFVSGAMEEKFLVGTHSKVYTKLSRWALLRDLAKKKGRYTSAGYKTTLTVCQNPGTALTRMRFFNIDHAAVRLRYDIAGVYLSRGRVTRALKKCKVRKYIVRELNIHHSKLDRLLTAYGFSKPPKINNHRITGIEHLASPVPVYDLEVEDFHNFVANEICVHNSSSSPNMQNIAARGILGKNLKKTFLPDNDDEVMVNLDYSGAEVRVMSSSARDEGLIKTLNDGLNIHSFVASEIFKTVKVKRADGTTSEVATTYDLIQSRAKLAAQDPGLHTALDQIRQFAKAAVFLTLYGGGANKLHENLSKEDPAITFADCEIIIESFLQRFPVIRTYMEIIKGQVRAQGYVKSKFGRRRRFPLAATDWRFRIDAEKEAINFPIQSTSSDLVLSQLCEMLEHEADIGFKPRITVHDSIAGSLPKASLPKLKAFLDKYAQERITEKFPWMPVPFIYEADYGPSYGECKTEVK